TETLARLKHPAGVDANDRWTNSFFRITAYVPPEVRADQLAHGLQRVGFRSPETVPWNRERTEDPDENLWTVLYYAETDADQAMCVRNVVARLCGEATVKMIDNKARARELQIEAPVDPSCDSLHTIATDFCAVRNLYSPPKSD